MAMVCVFDVNETLLDLGALDPHFARAFGDAGQRRVWFQLMLQSAFVSTITGDYHDFGALGAAALDALSTQRGVSLAASDRESILTGMRHLPAHPDVRPSLERLRAAGLRLATLTNSTEAVAEQQMTNSGLRDLFEQVLSADSVRRLKPAPEPYQMAAQRLGIEQHQMYLIAAHGWDIAGAKQAGCAAAFVARPGQALLPLAPAPEVIGADMSAVVEAILARSAA